MDGEPILQSDRDRRTWQWILEQVGEDAARAVELHGRRPYVSNIARALGLRPPETLERPDHKQVRTHLAEINRILGRRN